MLEGLSSQRVNVEAADELRRQLEQYKAPIDSGSRGNCHNPQISAYISALERIKQNEQLIESLVFENQELRSQELKNRELINRADEVSELKSQIAQKDRFIEELTAQIKPRTRN